MAHQQLSMGLALILATILCGGIATAQSDCTNVLISMSPCLNYISGNSTTPSTACCTQLGTVVSSQPRCLCQVLSGGGSNLGLNINQTQALALPRACNVETPPLSRCNAASPSDSPTSSPDSPNTGSGDGGSKTVPTGDGFSDATSNKMGVTMFVSVLFVASYVSVSPWLDSSVLV